jgi:hypothetical protein
VHCETDVHGSGSSNSESLIVYSFRYTSVGHTEPVFERLRRPGIDSEYSIQPAYVVRRAGTTNRIVVSASQAGNRFLGSLKGLQIRALNSPPPPKKMPITAPFPPFPMPRSVLLMEISPGHFFV